MNEKDKYRKDNLENIVFDKTTGIPIFHYYMEDVITILRQQHALGIIFVSLGNLVNIEEEYGSEIYEQILKKIGEAMQSLVGGTIRSEDLIAIAEIEPDTFVIFLSQKRTPGKILPEHLESVADRTYRFLTLKIYNIVRFYTRYTVKINVGFHLAIENPLIETRRLVCRSIADARKIAEYHSHKMFLRIRREIESLIQDPTQLSIEYQPVVDLKNKEVIGYEALTRGPRDTELYNPNYLFTLAEEVNLATQLDHVCRKLALEKLKGTNSKYKIFINVFPATIYDSASQRKELLTLIEEMSFISKNIVLEISEKHLIKSYTSFRIAANNYTDLGFSISVDDAGTGYSSLQMISEIKPRYIKIDISIIRDIHIDHVKRGLVKALKEIAEAINAELIAEGIEKEEEWNSLQNIGIKYGQGFFFARPGFPPLEKL